MFVSSGIRKRHGHNFYRMNVCIYKDMYKSVKTMLVYIYKRISEYGHGKLFH